MRMTLLLFLLFENSINLAQSIEKEFPLSIKVLVTNPIKTVRKNVCVYVSSAQLKKQAKSFNEKAFVVMDRETELASQYNEDDPDFPGIMVVLDELGALETRELVIRFRKEGVSVRKYTKRTQAELSYKAGGAWKGREYIGGSFRNTGFLRVPPEHKDHSWFIRYEGPGWESDKVGYRFYLDQRNATDVYGKKTTDMILQNVGLDGFDSYHNMQTWGMDVMKVGKSLGVGSIGTFQNGTALRVEKTDSVNCRITENGDVYSSILTNYYGWKIGEKKYNLQSRLSIHAGSRLSHEVITIRDVPDNICTGLVKDNAAELFSSQGGNGKWGYLATYGKQSLNSDNLGIAVLFNPNDFMEFTNDPYSEIVKLRTKGGKLEYFFLGAWEGEPGGITTRSDFKAYLDSLAIELANPVLIDIKP